MLALQHYQWFVILIFFFANGKGKRENDSNKKHENNMKHDEFV